MSTLHVELLTKARARMKRGKHIYLCDALNFVDGFNHSRACTELKRHIDTLIGGRFGLEYWLLDVHGIDTQWRGNDIRQLRIRWIDWLIEEWRDAP